MSVPTSPSSDQSLTTNVGNADVADRGDQALSYDFFKHLTTINLASIGGVFGLLKGSGPEVSPFAIIVIMTCLSFSGLMSIACLSQVAKKSWDKGAAGGIQATHLNAYQSICVTFLLLGLGIFTGIFLDGLISL